MNLAGTIHLRKSGICIIIVLLTVLVLYALSNNSSLEPTARHHKLSLKVLLQNAIRAAEAGGNEVVSAKNNLQVSSKGKTKEGAEDPVTTADYSSHCAMMKTLRHTFPTLQVISEEKVKTCPEDHHVITRSAYENLDKIPDEVVDESDVTVWVDPLDATTEYTEQLYQYVTTMVCVAIKGKPVMGVIHNPFSKNTSWAWVGGPMSQNLKAAKRDDDKVVSIIISRSHPGKIEGILNKTFKDAGVKIIKAAGAGYKVLEVVNGHADAYIHLTAIKKWDICAGNAILLALGGSMTTKTNHIISYTDDESPVNTDGIIATLKNHKFYVDKLFNF